MNLRAQDAQALAVDEAAWLERIVAVIRERKGLDFGAYRQPTLLRRVQNRMIAANVRTLPEYYERLRDDVVETDRLIERLTIKVSRFFRDPEAFEAMREALARRRAAGPDRVLEAWSAGCGHGEEPYSLAMLLDELGQTSACAVLATDVDPAALETASRGRYLQAAMEAVPEERRARHFVEPERSSEKVRGQPEWIVRPEIRARVDFRLHDLAGSVSSPEGRQFDLVCCRNVLIYFQVPAQLRVEKLLARSLRSGGLLCLGEAEWPHPAIAESFEVVDRKARLFEYRGERTTEER